MQWPFRLLNECHHRVEKPDISNKKRRGVLSLDLPSCFTRQIQRFWGGISRFGFQKRNRRPRIALGWSWSGARLLAYVAHKRITSARAPQFSFFFSRCYYSTVVGSCWAPVANEAPNLRKEVRPRKLPYTRRLWYVPFCR